MGRTSDVLVRCEPSKGDVCVTEGDLRPPETLGRGWVGEFLLKSDCETPGVACRVRGGETPGVWNDDSAVRRELT